MNIRSPALVACCTAVLVMTEPVTAWAATKNLVLKDAEPQYASDLCWAAAEALVVNQFYPQCMSTTGTPPPTPAFFRTSQGLETGYFEWRFSTKDPLLSALSSFLSNCEADIQNCNDWYSPQLYGLSFKLGTPDPLGLSWEAMTKEIDNGRPVLFKWGYLTDGTGSTPVGKHQMVVIGYSDDGGTQQLQIWDPLPVADPLPHTVPACGPNSSVVATTDHNTTIPFSTYRDPVNDMGVTALHDEDQWDIKIPEAPQLKVEPIQPPHLPPLPDPPPFHRPEPGLSFATALSLAQAQARLLDLQVSGGAPRSLGVPFPIVGLGFQQLLGALDDPTSLLTGTTSAVLFPVESNGEVVDAFLMLLSDGRWQRGGYANLGVTQRLVKVRALYAKQHPPIESFYMVSVPGEVAFFAAYGKGKHAILIPASTDPKIAAVAGKGVLADKQLRKLIHVIQSDLQRYQARSRATARR